MGLPSPFPLALVGLLGALPGLFLLGRVVARASLRDPRAQGPVAVALALALWLAAVHLASIAVGSFPRAFPAVTLALAALGLVLDRRSPRPDRDAGVSPWMLVGMGLSTLLVARVAIDNHFHDELHMTGHMSIAAEIQNGVYPPRHLTFPSELLRYHYAFDILTAAISAMLHVPLDRAIDVGALALWGLAFCLLWTLGERVVGARRAWLVPLLVLFGSGLPIFCPRSGPSIVPNLIDECWVGARPINVAFVSYFFQHPWSIGLVFATAALVLFADDERPTPALALLLAALSLSEIVLFVGLVPALVAASALRRRKLELRRALPMLLVALASLLGAKLFGGFFAASAETKLPFRFHLGVGDTLQETLVWNAKTFGVLLPAGLAGARFGRSLRLRRVLVLLALGGLAVVNFVRYERSGDIAKFATLAAIALGVLAATTIACLVPRRAALRTPRGRRRAALAAILALACSAAGVGFALVFLVRARAIAPAFRMGPERLSDADAQVATWLRARVRAGDVVYRRTPMATGYAQWAGLPTPSIAWGVREFGFSQERLHRREALLREPPDDARAFLDQGLRWLVLEQGAHADDLFAARADAFVARGAARVVLEIARLRVIEVLDVPAGS